MFNTDIETLTKRRHFLSRIGLSLTAALGLSLTTGPDVAHAQMDAGPAPIKVNLSEDGSRFAKLIFWNQLWLRQQTLNPGTLVEGEARDTVSDVGIRRSRMLLYGQISDRAQMVFHAGINNQTVTGGRKPQLFIHDAWGEIDIHPTALSVGMGLHYWNGVSRVANASTLNMLALDMPISNWLTIERSDQFARHMGVFAKGQLNKLGYRVAFNRPFTSAVAPAADGPAQYRPNAGTWMSAGYVEWFFDDIEASAVPYKTGTYLGKKSVFNIGAGWLYQPEAMGQLDADGNETLHDALAFGVDAFMDRPVGDGAITAYVGYSHIDFGPDFIRNIGIMNLGTPDSTSAELTYNGAGNAYPLIGTGEQIYTQAGYLLPIAPGGVGIQPYATTQVSLMEALDDPMIAVEGGANWYINGQNAKLSTQFRSRPIFETEGDQVIATDRAGEFILQLHVRI